MVNVFFNQTRTAVPIKVRRFLFLYICFSTAFMFKPDFLVAQQSFSSKFDSLLACTNDACKLQWNENIRQQIKESFKSSSELQPRSDFPKYYSVIESKDKLLRITSWCTVYDSIGSKCYGFVEAFSKRSKKFQLIELIDNLDLNSKFDKALLQPSKWSGCTYYNLIQTKHRGQTLYTLFGLNPGNGLTTKKWLEPLKISSSGTLQFGGNYFLKNQSESYSKNLPHVKASERHRKGYRTMGIQRFVLEYKSGLSVKLNWNEKSNRIEFNHLSPPNTSLVGQFQFYGPDFSVDAFVWRKGKWLLIEDMDARNPN